MKEITASELGSALRDLRNSKGLSEVEVARRCGFGQSIVTKTEKGEQFPNSRSLFRWLRALDTTPAAFFASLEAQHRHGGEVPIASGFEHYYRLLTGIIESRDSYFIKAIEGNLYGMLAATGRQLPPGVPDHASSETVRPLVKRAGGGRRQSPG